MHFESYQQIIMENVRTYVQELNLKRKWLMHQYNDPKHTSRSTKDRLKKNKGMKSMEWPKSRLWIQLKGCGLTWSKQFIGGNQPILQSWSGFVLRNGLKLLQAVVQDWLAVTRIVTCSYYCKKGSHQISRAKIHILLPHTDVYHWIIFLNK